MGAAPSSEILTVAPFRPARIGSGRVLTLIPTTQDFFPTPESPLFEQFFEARADPYVRYYIRNDDRDNRLDYIPPTNFTPSTLYARHVTEPSSWIYPNNEALRAAYYTARRSRIRPVPCAVAFQYDEEGSAPDGCVPLRNTFVRVIGGVGCFPNPNTESLDVEIFLRKSAGDHNMARVMLFAAWLFQEHCETICALPSVPIPALTFRGLKTNIPFLCFLRELRDRVELLQGNSEEHRVWLEGAFLRGHITPQHASELCVALSSHYRTLLLPKNRPKLAAPLSFPNPTAAAELNDSNRDGSEERVSPGGIGGLSRFQKEFYTLGGCVETGGETLPAASSDPNEVFLVCVDASVRVGGEKMASTPANLEVRRGDILRFVPDIFSSSSSSSANTTTGNLAVGGWPIAAAAEEELGMRETKSTVDAMADAETDGRLVGPLKLQKGTWQVDSTIHLENVLLALVHDECKSAREAPAEDSRWVRHAETGEHISDGSFYIWRFVRGKETYYYGTVPKFANTYKKRHDVPRRRNGRTPIDGMCGSTGSTLRECAEMDVNTSSDSSHRHHGDAMGNRFTVSPPQRGFMASVGSTPSPTQPFLAVPPPQQYSEGMPFVFVPPHAQTTYAMNGQFPMGPSFVQAGGGYTMLPAMASPTQQVLQMQHIPFHAMQPMQQVQPNQAVQSAHAMPSMQPVQVLHPMQSMQPMQPMPHVSQMAPMYMYMNQGLQAAGMQHLPVAQMAPIQQQQQQQQQQGNFAFSVPPQSSSSSKPTLVYSTMPQFPISSGIGEAEGQLMGSTTSGYPQPSATMPAEEADTTLCNVFTHLHGKDHGNSFFVLPNES